MRHLARDPWQRDVTLEIRKLEPKWRDGIAHASREKLELKKCMHEEIHTKKKSTPSSDK